MSAMSNIDAIYDPLNKRFDSAVAGRQIGRYQQQNTSPACAIFHQKVRRMKEGKSLKKLKEYLSVQSEKFGGGVKRERSLRI